MKYIIVALFSFCFCWFLQTDPMYYQNRLTDAQKMALRRAYNALHQDNVSVYQSHKDLKPYMREFNVEADPPSASLNK